MKTIVTHIGPDVDAITSVWLLKTFLPEWEEASVAFVPAGKTLEGKPADSDPEIVHVDTGFGRYDHHQTNARICAALLVYETVKDRHGVDPALERLLKLVNDGDHFQEVFYPDPTSDVWEYTLTAIVNGWRLLYSDNPIQIVDMGMKALDALYKQFQTKIWAEKELDEKAQYFDTIWGRAMAIESTNDDTLHIAQKRGCSIAIRRDPKKGHIRIKSLPKDDIDLSGVHSILQSSEPDIVWFLHASHHMILNGSSKNPDMIASKKTLSEVIEVVKSYKLPK